MTEMGEQVITEFFCQAWRVLLALILYVLLLNAYWRPLNHVYLQEAAMLLFLL